MREAFNNQQQKTKIAKQQNQHQVAQLSQRSNQQQVYHHQKTNSVSNKAQVNANHTAMTYDEHQVSQKPISMKSQPSTNMSQLHQSMNYADSQKLTSLQQNPGQGIAQPNQHKKSNSLMNSKMAQILLKGPQANTSAQAANNSSNLHKVPNTNASLYSHGGNINGMNGGSVQVQQNLATVQQQQVLQQSKQQSNNAGNNLLIHSSNLSKQQHNQSNLMSQGGGSFPLQSSFQNHPNDILQYSIDYQKAQFLSEDYEDPSNQSSKIIIQQQQQFLMNQAPSQKQIMHQAIKNPSINLEAYIQQQQQQTIDNTNKVMNFKQQPLISTITTATNNHNHTIATQKPQQEKSAQKTGKKVMVSAVASGGHHQRTKSDTYYNRGSIKPSQGGAISAVGSQQQKTVGVRVNSGVSNQQNKNLNYFIEGEQTKQTQINKNIKIATLNENGIQLQPRKAPNSAHHSKKPSQSGNISTITQPKKSTKDKYNELKAMYDELLEKHYQQQQQLQQIVPGKFQNSISNNNLGVLYQQPPQQPLSSHLQQMIQQHQIMDNPTALVSNTPRLTITNQLSSSGLNNNNYYNQQQQQHQQPMMLNSIDFSGKNLAQVQAKPIKPLTTAKLESESNQLKPKTIIKLQLNQGQSRKNAQGNHKRSVSDGNDQLFKFKQQNMQRYLYPQPSNSTIQPSIVDPNNAEIAAPQNSEETLASNRSKAALNQPSLQNVLSATPYQQQASHMRRASDDYNNKYKKQQQQQQILQAQNNQQPLPLNQQQQQQLLSKSNLQTLQQQQNQTSQENVFSNSEYPNDGRKPQTTDFNIKGFLLEMRNKQNLPQNSAAFINIVDEQTQSLSSTNNLQQKVVNKNDKQFAMIIEENANQNEQIAIYPNNNNQLNNVGSSSVLDSSRKTSVLMDSQSQQSLSQASKPNIEFNKIIQKYKHMKFEDKRTSSPTLDFERNQNSHSKKNLLVQTQHKRIKSDVPDVPIKKENPLVSNMYVKHNNLMNIQAQVNQNQHQQKVIKKPSQAGKNTILQNSNPSESLLGFSVSDKTTPQKQLQPQVNIGGLFSLKQHQQQQYQLSQQLESSIGYGPGDSKKVINVSIDLIKDGMMMNDGNISHLGLDDSQSNEDIPSSGNWIVVDQVSTQNLNLDQIMKQHKEQNAQLQKKPLSKQGYVQKSVQLFGNIQFSGGSNQSKGNQVPVRHEKYKKMLQKYENSEESNVHSKQQNNRKYTFDVGIPGVLSSSPSPSNCQVSPKGRLSINDKMNELYKKQLSSKVLLPNSPKGGVIQPHQKIKMNNLMQPQPNKKHQQQTERQQLQSNRIVPPTSNPPPNNSIVQTQESPRPSLQPTTQLIIPSHVQVQQLTTERIDTQDSDINLSPRTRAVNKLLKHIKLSFKQTQQPPSTTVDFYRIGKVLGKGAFGKVNLALHKLSGRFAAIKSINKQYLSEDAQTKKVMQEVVILKRTRHRNIVRLYEFFETQKHILFVIELCAGGDLLNYVRKRRKLKEEVARVIFKQIIEGLSYCHSKNILHRDIKLDNILLDSEGEVKICDFGVSKIVKKGEIMTEQCGTPAYIAPEILRDKGYTGFAVDIWSAGVVLYAMLYGTVPFKANNMSELQKLIVKAKYTLKEEGVSEEARSLLTSLLEKDPLKRLTIPQILQHKWFADGATADVDVQLFTEQEKEYIRSEFTYNDTERYNRNEADLFTDHMLDSTNNSMLRNQTSKSVILAPFNSTKSDVNAPAITESMKALIQSKRCMKFAARCRDADKQYEINNNAELDNGVYHKEEEEEKKEENKQRIASDHSDGSLESSFKKESSLKSNDDEEELRIKQQRVQKQQQKKEKQSELEKLESLIYQKEEEEEAYQNPKQNDKIQRSPREIIPKPKTSFNGLETAQTLIIDDKYLALVELMGYPRDYIVKCLNNNDLNYATTGYFLLQNQNALSYGGVSAINIIR